VAGWSSDELAQIARTDHVKVTSRRPDGSLRPYVTIWAVRSGEDIYVRSAYGPENGWYRRAKASGEGRIRVEGLERDVAFETPDPSLDEEVSAAYHAKYDRYGPRTVGTVVSTEAVRTTLRLLPRQGPAPLA
jgi:hypothetical protein